jgi:23S rRNA pseudouridine1911/1915/1917 synthase
MTWQAPLPQDMQDLVAAVRLDSKENPEDMI